MGEGPPYRSEASHGELDVLLVPLNLPSVIPDAFAKVGDGAAVRPKILAMSMDQVFGLPHLIGQASQQGMESYSRIK